MSTLVVAVPPIDLVSDVEAKLWAPVLAGDDENRVKALLKAAQAALEPPSWLRSALGRQDLEMHLDGFGWCGALDLTCGPVREILSVKYDDENGEEQTVDPATYSLLNPNSVLGRLMIRPRQAWPRARAVSGAVRVRYRVGYEADDPAILPAKHAIVLGALRLRSLSTQDLSLRSVEAPGLLTRTWTVSDAASKLIKDAVEDLLAAYRVWSV